MYKRNFAAVLFTLVTLLVTLFLHACSDAAKEATGKSDLDNLEELVKISISPNNPNVVQNTKYQLSAIGIFSDNSKADLSNNVEWVSSDTNIAKIQEGGKLEASNAGTTSIRASIAGVKSEPMDVNVYKPTLLSITIDPLNPVTATGTGVEFKAVGIFSGGITQDITDSVAWASSNNTVATFSPEDGTTAVMGFAAAQSTGTTDISATYADISSQAVTLSVQNAQLQQIDVIPNQGSIGKGTHLAFTATGLYLDSDSAETFVVPLTNLVTWTSSDQNIAAVDTRVRVSGMVSGIAPGSVQISAQWSGVSSNTVELTVHDTKLESILIETTQLKLPLSMRHKFRALGTYSDQSQQDLSYDVVWLLRTEPYAFVDNAYTRSGLLSPTSVGATILTASFRDTTSPRVDVDIVDVEVVSVAVSPETVTLAKGLTQQFTAIATFNDDSQRDVTNDSYWASTDASLASVSNTDGGKGLVTALLVTDAVDITARYESVISNIASVKVSNATLNSGSIVLKLSGGTDPSIWCG